MSTLPLRPLGFGEIVDGALQLCRRDFGFYYLTMLAAAVPAYAILTVNQPDPAAFDPDPANPFAAFAGLGPSILWLFVYLGVSSLGWIAVCAAIGARTKDRPASVAAAYGTALRRLPSVWGAWLLVALATVFVALAWALVVGILTAIDTRLGIVGFILTGFALALVGSGVTFGILPAAVIERRGPARALARSVSLCRGGMLRVIGIVFVAYIVSFIPTAATMAFVGFEEFFASPDAAGQVGSGSQWIANTVGMLVQPLTTMFFVACMVVLFHDRRVRREGYDLEARAQTLETA